jgi:hypothetical protein
MSPQTKETLLKFIVLSWSWEIFKVGVALPGRIDTWGVTVGIRAGFRSLGVKIIFVNANNLGSYLVLTKI